MAQPGTGQAGETYQVLGGEAFQPSKPIMYYQIHGRPAFTYGDLHVRPEATVLANGKAMLWMDGSLEVATECYGGCCASCMRACAGESCCMNTYSGAGGLTVGFDLPGDMLAFAVTPSHSWMLTKAAFVAGTTNLRISSRWGGCLACCCGDEGPFLTTVEINPESGTQEGVFLAGSYGMLERHDIAQGKVLYVGRGCFFAAHSSGSLNMTLIGGCMNLCCGAGVKALVFKFVGPCTVYTQSRNPEDLRRMQTMGQQEKEQQDQGDGGDGGGDS